MIAPRGTAGAQSARQPAGASSAQSACQPAGASSAQSVIPTAYAMPQSVVRSLQHGRLHAIIFRKMSVSS